MQGYNAIVVFNETEDRMLMCRRKKNPYQGLSNFVGGKIEVGEDGMAAAYRELREETSITPKDITLTHMVDFTYYLVGCYLEIYVGNSISLFLYKAMKMNYTGQNWTAISLIRLSMRERAISVISWSM